MWDHARARVILGVIVSVVVAAGCSDDSAAVAPLEVEFAVSMQDCQAWSASGPAVGAGLMCGEVQRRWPGAEDLNGRPLTIFEVGVLQREAGEAASNGEH